MLVRDSDDGEIAWWDITSVLGGTLSFHRTNGMMWSLFLFLKD